MRHAVSNELYAYWAALRNGATPPERNELEPGAIRGILADTFLLEFDAQNGFPFRIAGSRVNSVFMKELRGSSFLQIWRKADHSTIKSTLRRVADEAEPRILLAEARAPGLGPVELEVALLPLRHQGASHARMLGSLASGGGSEWFGLIGCEPAMLVSHHPIEADRRPSVSSPDVSFWRRGARSGSREQGLT
jgi:hypothetical protein